MFGMGFMEIFLIAIVAIIALGPEKLPNAMVDIARFLKKFKSGIDDAKSTLDNELNIAEMREEAAKYKAQIEDAKRTLSIKDNMDLGLNDIINEDASTSKKEKLKDDSELVISPKDDENIVETQEKNEKKEKKKKSKKEEVKLEDIDGLEEIK